jgi:hypothetical protein
MWRLFIWCSGPRVRVLRLRAYKGLLISRVLGRLDFIMELFPRRAAARETLVGCCRILVDLRGVCDRASTAWARCLEFWEFPLF